MRLLYIWHAALRILVSSCIPNFHDTLFSVTKLPSWVWKCVERDKYQGRESWRLRRLGSFCMNGGATVVCDDSHVYTVGLESMKCERLLFYFVIWCTIASRLLITALADIRAEGETLDYGQWMPTQEQRFARYFLESIAFHTANASKTVTRYSYCRMLAFGFVQNIPISAIH